MSRAKNCIFLNYWDEVLSLFFKAYPVALFPITIFFSQKLDGKLVTILKEVINVDRLNYGIIIKKDEGL